MVILYLRFGAKALQDNFVAELSTHYQNYILSNCLVFIMIILIYEQLVVTVLTSQKSFS